VAGNLSAPRSPRPIFTLRITPLFPLIPLAAKVDCLQVRLPALLAFSWRLKRGSACANAFFSAVLASASLQLDWACCDDQTANDLDAMDVVVVED
jgi:hypothetical protein